MPIQYADSERLSAGHAVEAMPKWQLVGDRMHLLARFADFRRATGFVARIGEMAEDANHHPEIDMRGTRVHLALNSHDVRGITTRDIRLGNAIVPLIKIFDGEIDDGVFSETQITIDTADVAQIRPFWAAIYGYRLEGEDALVDPMKSGPRIWFQHSPAHRPERGRTHVDVLVPCNQATERVRAAIAAGGTLVTAAYAPAWWVLTDAQGNEACVCTWRPAPLRSV